MPYNLIVSPAAKEEIFEIIEWYESKGEKVGEKFAQALLAAFERIIQNPTGLPFAVAPIRYYSVPKFPYQVVYVVEGENITIISCVHAKREPRNWTDFF